METMVHEFTSCPDISLTYGTRKGRQIVKKTYFRFVLRNSCAGTVLVSWRIGLVSPCFYRVNWCDNLSCKSCAI